MTEFSRLFDAAYKSELAASRKLAASTGMDAQAALLQILTDKAGAAGLSALLAQRVAEGVRATARLAERAAREQARRLERVARHEAPPGTWRGWFDGSAKPNPGRCGIGAVLSGPGGEQVTVSRDAGYGNSSEAEYQALIALLEAAVAAGAADLAIHGDSRVVIDDMRAAPAAAAPSLAALRRQAQALLAQLGGATLRWIPRHKNAAADRLAARTDGPQTLEVR